MTDAADKQASQPAADALVAEPNWLKDKIVRFRESDVFYSFKRSPVTIVAFTLVVVLVTGALLGPLLAPQNPHNPAELNLMDGFTAPMAENQFTGNFYLLGTDDQGRDIFSAILYGLRISLLVGFVSVLFAGVLGVTLGLISGFFGGWIDTLIMRIADIQLTFPSILIAMLIYGIARGLVPVEMRNEAAIYILILSIGLSEWVQFARTVRGATLVEREKEYVQAARLIGLGRFPIMLRHVLPNVMGPVLVIGTIGLALAIIAEATLSFLGVGAPPTTPSLGTLIRIGQDFLFSGEWWIILFPSLTLLVLALSVNLLGDWLRDVLNPKLR